MDGRTARYVTFPACKQVVRCSHALEYRVAQEDNPREACCRHSATVCGVLEAILQATSLKGTLAHYTSPYQLLNTLIQSLPADVLARIAEIVHYMQKRQYQRANDSYLRLSIGNAPWPIGVTMVGYVRSCNSLQIFV